MTYNVLVTARAKRDLEQYHRWTAEHAPETALQWLDRFEASLETLAQHPQRCPLAPEAKSVGLEIRQYLFGRGRNMFRALFTIEDQSVVVLHIRRGGRESAMPEDLFD